MIVAIVATVPVAAWAAAESEEAPDAAAVADDEPVAVVETVPPAEEAEAAEITPAEPVEPVEADQAVSWDVATQDAPDPYLVADGDGWLLYSTAVAGVNVPVWRSTDLVNWYKVGDAVPEVPTGMDPTRIWAPSVVAVDGGHVLYVTMFELDTGRPCIVAMSASDPEGPYEASTATNIVCDTEDGGAIDASVHVDATGVVWLLWKTDGNCCGMRTELRTAPLSEDGRSLVGEAVTLVQSAVGEVIEGPSMILDADGTTLLLYSAGDWSTGGYHMQLSRCEGPTGPCEPATDVAAEGEGAGGGELVSVDGSLQVVYHRWVGEPGEWGSVRGAVVQPLSEIV